MFLSLCLCGNGCRNAGEYLPYTSRMNVAIETQLISKLRYGTEDDLFSTAFSAAVWISIPGSNPPVSATTVDVAFGKHLDFLSNLYDVKPEGQTMLKLEIC